MGQTSLFSYLEEQEPIGKVLIDKGLLLSMLQAVDDISGSFNYYVGKGIWYTIDILEYMAVLFKSEVLSVNTDKKKFFTIDAYKIKELVRSVGKDNVELTIYDGAISVFSNKVSRAFVTYREDVSKVINVNKILKSNNYTKVKIDIDKLIDAIRWVKGTGKVRHNRASFVIRNGSLMLYDYNVGKDGKFDEAKAVIGNVVGSDGISSTYNTSYLDIVSKFLSKNRDSIKNLYLYLCTDCPLIVRGKVELSGKMKDVSNDMKFDFVIGPIVMEE